jgi:hypothetical protein
MTCAENEISWTCEKYVGENKRSDDVTGKPLKERFW